MPMLELLFYVILILTGLVAVGLVARLIFDLIYFGD